MSVLSILQIVLLVFDILFFVVFGLCLLFGFIKGWKKGMLNVLAFLVPFLILLCFSGMFGNILLGISIPGLGSVKEFISTTIVEMVYPEGTSSPELIAVCESIAKAVINVIVYIAILIVALILSYIIRIVLRFTLKRFIFSENDGRRCAPSMKSRLFGLIPGFVNFLLIVVILFYPLAGIMNVADMATEDVGYVMKFIESEDEQMELSSTTDLFKDINEGLNNSSMYKIAGMGKNKKTGVSIAGSYLGSLLKIKNGDVKVNLVKEYGKFRQIIPIVSTVLESYEEDEQINLAELDKDEIEAFASSIQETNLLKLVAPAVREYLVFQIKDSNIDEEIITKIENINLNDELNKITNVVVEIINAGSDLVIDIENPQDILLVESLPNSIGNIIKASFESDIINYILLPEGIKQLNENLPEDFAPLKEILTEESIKECLENDVAKLLTVYQDLSKYNNLHNFIFNDEELEYKLETALNNIEQAIVKVFTLSLISGNEETLLKFALDYADVEGLTYDALFKDMDVNWSEEVTHLATTLKVTLQIANELNLEENIENLSLETLIKKDENGHYVLETLLNEVADSNIFKNVIINYLETLQLDGEVQEILEIIDLESIRKIESDEFKAEFVRLLEMFDAIVEMNILEEGPNNISGANLKPLIKNISESIFIKGKESKLIEYALRKANVEGLTYETLFKDYEPNWEEEKTILVDMLYSIIDLLDEYELYDSFSIKTLIKKDANEKYIFEPVINDISESQLLREIMLNYLDSMELTGEVADFMNILNLSKLKDLTSQEFASEAILFLDIISMANDMNLLDEGDLIITEESIEDIILTLFKSSLIKGSEEEIITYFLDTTGVSTTLSENDITLNFTNVNWETEPQKIVNVLCCILKIGTLESFDISTLISERDENSENLVVDLIVAFGESDIFGESLFTMMEKMVSEAGYEIAFTNEEKAKVKENTWEKEVNNLLDLIDFCTEKLGTSESYETITGQEVTDMMTKASETVIATKVLGSVLNEMLGQDYLAINPVLEDGTYKYDFTNASTLASTAKDIGALIDIKNNAQNLDMSNIEDASTTVESVVESIKILDESGLAKDMLQEVIGTDSGVNLDEINLSQEADTVQKVYDVYKEDHENFDIEEHPELKEELENSDFAQTILDMLGICKKDEE